MNGYGGYEGHGFGLMMGGGLVWLLVFALLLWIYGRIVGRAGFSRWWVLLAVVPVVNLIMLWVFAFIDWPAVDQNHDRERG